jgi:hypothetical protein
MSADFDRVRILDDRVSQPRPKYGCVVGASSITNQRYLATSTPQAITWQVRVPNTSTFIDRLVQMDGVYYLTFSVVRSVAGNLLNVGDDFGCSAFPLQHAFSSNNSSVNGETCNLQSELLPMLLRLTNTDSANKVRTTAHKLEMFASYDDAYNSSSYSLAGLNTAPTRDTVPNGSGSVLIQFTDPAGTVLSGNGSYVGATGSVNYVDGIPVYTAGLGSNIHSVYVRLQSREPFVLPPFLWLDDREFEEVGIYGIQQINTEISLTQPNRVLKFSTQRGSTVDASTIVFNTGVSNPVSSFYLNLLCLSPNLATPPPAQSVVPSFSFDRFTQSLTAIPASSLADPTRITTTPVVSNTYSINTIPDMFLIFIRDNTVSSTRPSDVVAAIKSINITFSNVDGLCSTYSQEMLYKASARNGVCSSWDEFRGYANHSTRGIVPTSGSYLALVPGTDFGLGAPALCPGVLGAFSFQMSLEVYSGVAMSNPILYIVPCRSSLFCSQAGSSKISGSLLTQDAVLALGSEDSDPITKSQAMRAVGGVMTGGSVLSSLGSMLSTARQAFEKAKPVLKTIRQVAEATGHPTAKRGADVMKALGLGNPRLGMRGMAE